MVLFKKIIAFVFCILIAFSSMGVDLMLSSSMNINSDANYGTITINGGNLTISSGAVVSCNALVLSGLVSGSVTQPGLLTVTGSNSAHKSQLTVNGTVNYTTNGLASIVSDGIVLVTGDVYMYNAPSIASGLNQITLNGGSFTVNGGINEATGKIISANTAIAVRHDLYMVGGLVNLMQSSTLSIGGDINATATTNSIFISHSSAAITGSVNHGGNLSFASGSSITINGDFNISGTAGLIQSDANSFITVKGNLTNNSPSQAFNSNGTTKISVILGGGNQTLNGGNCQFTIYSLTFSGTANSVKTINITNPTITSTLNLTNTYIYVGGNVLSVTNTDPAAVQRSTGFVFVEWGAGAFIRYTNSVNDYLFPMGYYTTNGKGTVSNPRYRPAIITPTTTTLGQYAASVVGGNYSNAGYSSSTHYGVGIIPNNIPPNSTNTFSQCSLNNNFYHRVAKYTSTSPSADITIFYNSTVDNCNGVSPVSYNALAKWFSNTQKWQLTSNTPAAGLSGTDGLTGVKTLNYTLPLNSSGSYDVLVLSNNGDATIPEPYAVLLKKLDGGFYLTNKSKVYFRFEEEYFVGSAGTNLVFNIYDINRNIVTATLNNAIVLMGDNRYIMDVTPFTTNNYYVLEVINSKNEKWYLRFQKI